MKIASFILSIVLLLVGGVSGALGQPVEPKVADTLQPTDLGLRKWTFETKAKPAEVTVFRERTYKDGKLERTYELIINHPGETCEASVLLLDHDFLSGENGSGKYSIKADSNGGILVRQILTNTTFGTCFVSEDQTVVISFASNRNEVVSGQPQKLLKFEYDLRTESYDTLKKRVPKLPPLNTGFFWYTQDPPPDK